MNFFIMPPQPELQVQWKLTCARIKEWLQSDFFHPLWWILLALFIMSAYLWWKLADKSKLSELTLYTAIIILFIIVLDELGEELSLWYYSVDITPLFPPISAVNITSMPLIYMLIYQRFRSWKSFVIATAAMSVVFCFVFEPIFVWSGIYTKLAWKSYYGLPLYFFIAVASKFMVIRIYAASYKTGRQGRPGE